MASLLNGLSFTASSSVQATPTQPYPGNLSNSTLGNAIAALNISSGFILQIGNGTAAGTANIFFCQERKILANTSETLNIANGTLLSIFSANLTMVSVNYYRMELIDDPDGGNTATSVTVGNAAHPFQGWFGANTTTYTLDKGGVPYEAGSPSGKTVTANASDQIKVANNDAGNAAFYRLTLVGA